MKGRYSFLAVPKAVAGFLLIQAHSCLLECLAVLGGGSHSQCCGQTAEAWGLLVAFLQGGMCRKWMNALYFTGGKELWVQTKLLPLQVKNSNRGVHRVAFKLIKWSLFIFLFMYQFKNQWWSICLHHISAESALSLHFLGVLSASYSGVDLAFWSLHIWFCECSAAWISSTCFHCALLLSRYVLSCQICLWWFLSVPSVSSDCCSARTVTCVGKKRFPVKARTTWISHMDVLVWIPGPWEGAVHDARNLDLNFRYLSQSQNLW